MTPRRRMEIGTLADLAGISLKKEPQQSRVALLGFFDFRLRACKIACYLRFRTFTGLRSCSVTRAALAALEARVRFPS